MTHGLTLLGMEKRDLHDGDDLLCLYDTQYGNQHENYHENENENNHKSENENENENVRRIDIGGSVQHKSQNSIYRSAVADRNVQTKDHILYNNQPQSTVRTTKGNNTHQTKIDGHVHLRSHFQEGICVPFTLLSGPSVDGKIHDIKESCTYVHDDLASTMISLYATSLTRG